MVSVQPNRFRLNRTGFSWTETFSVVNPQNQDLSLRPPLPGPGQTIRALHTRGMGTQHLRKHPKKKLPEIRPKVSLWAPFSGGVSKAAEAAEFH